ncbi:exported hypothetical protein [Candidatus Sulfopaludibacter sp. SbA6]|nr:exported hypothetical protein [Candidatus Sulfopaludibacter sp. SbA6]
MHARAALPSAPGCAPRVVADRVPRSVPEKTLLNMAGPAVLSGLWGGSELGGAFKCV